MGGNLLLSRHLIKSLLWASQLTPAAGCWYACCWAAGAGAGSADPPPPKSMLERPWPTVEPTATPAAVEAIWPKRPGPCC